MRTNGGGRRNRVAALARMVGRKGVQIRRATYRGYVIEGSAHGGLPGFRGLTYYKRSAEVNMDTSTR